MANNNKISTNGAKKTRQGNSVNTKTGNKGGGLKGSRPSKNYRKNKLLPNLFEIISTFNLFTQTHCADAVGVRLRSSGPPAPVAAFKMARWNLSVIANGPFHTNPFNFCV